MAHKKWQLRYRTTSAVDNFPSQSRAYDFIQDLARSYFADPDSMDPRVYVYVDEREGNGWQRHEDVNLAEWGTPVVAVRGFCSVCDRKITITKAGNVRHHGVKSKAWPPPNCVGSGKAPKGEGK